MTRHFFAGAIALIGLTLAGLAHASTDVTPSSPAQSLSCLQRPVKAPTFPEQHAYDRSFGFARVKLSFTAADRAPKVEILANTLRQDMFEVVSRYLDDYRLPCLQPSDGTVTAVQEFEFSNTGMAPLPLPAVQSPTTRLARCFMNPASDPVFNGMNQGRDVSNIALTMTFSGDATQPPVVKVLHAEAVDSAIDDAVEWARDSRLPCRNAGDPPVVLMRVFKVYPAGVGRRAFKVSQLELTKFLAMTEDPQREPVHFDFTTMGCPFNVDYTIYQPGLPNTATDGERRPDRAIFIAWLARQDLKFSSPKMARALFSETLQVQVPCGRLELGDKT